MTLLWIGAIGAMGITATGMLARKAAAGREDAAGFHLSRSARHARRDTREVRPLAAAR